MKPTIMKTALLLLCAITTTSLIYATDSSKETPKTPTTTGETAKATTPAPAPHCQVPCGIYTDQLRFEQMLEDTKTIAKAIASVNEFANGLSDAPPSAKGMNQVMRWITTKEDHASNIQKIVAEYFLTQRIKESNKEYSNQLITAHKVMVAAMKCKQDANAATAETLKEAILNLYRAYEGKEPKFENHN